MNRDLQSLIELQAADQEIARLVAEIAELPKRVAVIEQKLATTKAQLEQEKQGIAAGLNQRRKQEAEIQDWQQKISKYRDQSLAVKTNEQYKALLHEIEFAEKGVRACEDRILEVMVDTEAREANVKLAESELKAEMAEIEKETAQAQARTAEDERQLAVGRSKRDALRADVAEEYLGHYERVVRQRKSAIAEARGQKCLACNVMLRPQTYNELKGGERLITCESCSRILYYDPANETEPAPVRRASPEVNAVDSAAEAGASR